MKLGIKNLGLVAIVIILLLSTNIPFGISKPSAFGANVGDRFTFAVNKYYMNFTFDTTSKQLDTFSVAGSDNITAGTTDAKFNITVLEVIEAGFLGCNLCYGSVTFEVMNDNHVINKTSDMWSILGLTFPLMLPLMYAGIQAGATPAELLIFFPSSNDIVSFIPYILPDLYMNNTNGKLWEYLLSTFNETQEYRDEYDELIFGYGTNSTLKAGNFTVNGFGQGTIQNETTGGSLTMDSHIQFVYNSTTAALQSFKMFVDIDGTTPDETVSVDYDIEFVLESSWVSATGTTSATTATETTATGTTSATTATETTATGTTSATTATENTTATTATETTADLTSFDILALIAGLFSAGVIVMQKRRKRI